jgi:DNA-binding NtrC family response regulator
MPEAVMKRRAPIRVLVVTADPTLRDGLCKDLAVRGYSAVAAPTQEDGFEQAEHSSFDVALVDLALPGGMDLVRRMALEDLATESVVVRQPDACPLEAMRLGAYGCVTRPARAEELDVLLARATEKGHLRRQNLSLRMRLRQQEPSERLVTGDPAMKQALVILERAAPAEIPVLIRGENGSGRGLMARTLHRSSPRAQGPFVAVNCRLVAAGRLEDELFGCEKGALPGAVARRAGLLELAAGGVVFLEEIEQATPGVQAKLLRLIEARELLRVGAVQPVGADVRIVAATSEDLRARARDGRFREDLFYRLSAVTIALPPLRERMSDVPLLAVHFLEQVAGSAGRMVSAQAHRALLAYSWPGNVRELRMVIERAALLENGDTLEVDHLPSDLREPGAAALRAGLTLEEVEREYILTTLRRHEGHRGRAARALGIDPKTLYNKLGPERPRRRRDSVSQ